jgi:hypothetical protein
MLMIFIILIWLPILLPDSTSETLEPPSRKGKGLAGLGRYARDPFSGLFPGPILAVFWVDPRLWL